MVEAGWQAGSHINPSPPLVKPASLRVRAARPPGNQHSPAPNSSQTNANLPRANTYFHSLFSAPFFHPFFTFFFPCTPSATASFLLRLSSRPRFYKIVVYNTAEVFVARHRTHLPFVSVGSRPEPSGVIRSPHVIVCSRYDKLDWKIRRERERRRRRREKREKEGYIYKGRILSFWIILSTFSFFFWWWQLKKKMWISGYWSVVITS